MPGPTVYVQLAERVGRDVHTFRDGVAIPSIRSLARRYNVSPNTVRKAFGILLGQGYIARTGACRQYVRRRPASQPSFAKPHPAVGLSAFVTLNFAGQHYMALLIGCLLRGLRARHLTVCVLPDPDQLTFSPLTGGLLVGPADCRLSGMVLVSGGPAPLLEAWVAAGTVVMTLDYMSDVSGVDSVAVDCEAEAATIVEYLAARGHRAIAFLDTPHPDPPFFWSDGVDPDSRRFSRALLRCKEEHGLDSSARYHMECETDKTRSDAAVRGAVDRLWRLKPPPTALVCFDPVAADQARTALAERGRRCPDDVSIVARGQAPEGRPDWTLLASDPERMSAAAAEHMFNRLTNPQTAPTRLLFASRLLIGPTTGPAPLLRTASRQAMVSSGHLPTSVAR